MAQFCDWLALQYTCTTLKYLTTIIINLAARFGKKTYWKYTLHSPAREKERKMSVHRGLKFRKKSWYAKVYVETFISNWGFKHLDTRERWVIVTGNFAPEVIKCQFSNEGGGETLVACVRKKDKDRARANDNVYKKMYTFQMCLQLSSSVQCFPRILVNTKLPAVFLWISKLNQNVRFSRSEFEFFCQNRVGSFLTWRIFCKEFWQVMIFELFTLNLNYIVGIFRMKVWRANRRV